MPSVLSNYCVSFYTDRTTGNILLQPAVTFVGTIPLRTLVDMAGNPHDPSHTDSIIASLKKFDLKR